MTRMLLLAALALACVLSLSPAFAMAYPPEWGSPGDPAARFTIAAVACLAFFAAAALASLVFTRGHLGRFRATGPAAFAILLVFLTAPAFAADDTTVALSAAPWIEMVREILLTIVIPAVAAYVIAALRRTYPMAALFLTQRRVEQLGNAATEFAINAIPGAVKEAKLSVNVGSAVIAKAVQYGIDAAPAKAMEAAGGPEGLAKIVFRKLNLADEANETNTLLPAIATVRLK